jgi:hypothetical protein
MFALWGQRDTITGCSGTLVAVFLVGCMRVKVVWLLGSGLSGVGSRKARQTSPGAEGWTPSEACDGATQIYLVCFGIVVVIEAGFGGDALFWEDARWGMVFDAGFTWVCADWLWPGVIEKSCRIELDYYAWLLKCYYELKSCMCQVQIMLMPRYKLYCCRYLKYYSWVWRIPSETNYNNASNKSIQDLKQ